MNRIVRVSAGPGYNLEVVFDNGISGNVDLSSRLFGPVFEPLRDPVLFSQVRVDEYGAVYWPNGADLAPDAIYRTISSQAEYNRLLASSNLSIQSLESYEFLELSPKSDASL